MEAGLQCIVMFGATTMEAFQQITTYITSMETKQTTGLRTLNCSSNQNTPENMDTKEINTPNQPNNETMHSNNPIVPYISLCSGYEGIGLGLHRCIPNLRCVAYCEREAFAIANLVAKMESGLLDAAPVFTDVTNFPWADYAPYMAGGILSFGWPCQPVSCAGKRKATEDERWLFDIIADGISILRPGMLFAENVEGLLSARMPDGSSVFGHCIERLESLHYKVAAGIFSASEVGAPHQRKRVFIFGLAESSPQHAQGGINGMLWREDSKHGIPREHRGSRLPVGVWPSRPGELANARHLFSRGWPESTATEYPDASNGSQGVGNAINEGVEGTYDNGGASRGIQPYAVKSSATAWASRPGEPQHPWEPPRVVGNSSRQRCEQDSALRGEQQPSGAGEERGAGVAEAVGNSDCGRLSSGIDTRSCSETDSGGQDNIKQTECGKIEPEMGRDIDGTTYGMDISELSGLSYSELAEIREWMVKGDNRTDELRSCGNGVVPATAERAFRVLMEELINK